MTTMAWDGKTVAIDGLSTCGSMIVDTRAEKFLFDENVLLLGCGQADQLRSVFMWLLPGSVFSSSPKPDCSGWEFSAWMFRKGHAPREYISSVDFWCPLAPRDASGSGREIALTAMHLGRDAFGAIQAASELDVYTGGLIRSWNIAELFEE